MEGSQLAPLWAISQLETRLLRSAQEEPPVDKKTLLGRQTSLVSAGVPVFLVCTPGIWDQPMFASGHFPFLPPGWSVDVRNG